MIDANKLLSDGIELLCGIDSEVNSILTSRKDDVILLLTGYINEIELFNHAYGLVGTEKTEELIIKHILDALAPMGILSRLLRSFNCRDSGLAPLREIYRIADAGSGAGLPGIPLAIAMPSCEFTLIERMGRRAGFLCNTKAVLSLSNINIEECEIEKIAGKKDFTEYFDIVTFRAFKPLDAKLLKSLFAILAPNGIIAAYKGKKEKIETEMKVMPELQWEAVPYTVPFLDEERHVLIIKK
ncbi:MAG: 16S rRNA (guanine(527)-N(7))-methyltransferase RsmG [Treponema sp.]|nr:16S rRNA (guanine(527)-N(7))-methyltransferase RsmG [Treponema sp.]